LEPPVAGNAWHPPQPSKLKRGPNPSGTVSTSLNRSVAALKKATSFGPRPGSGPPAPGAPPRGPGSTAELVCGAGCGCGGGCGGGRRNCAKAGPDDKAVAPNNVMAMPAMDHLHACFVISISPSSKCTLPTRIRERSNPVVFCWTTNDKKNEINKAVDTLSRQASLQT